MNQKNKSKPHKVFNLEEYNNSKILTKVYDKEFKNFIYKSTDVLIKISSSYIKICDSKKNSESQLFNLCMKHSCFSRATDNTIPRIDSCRIFGDPFRQDTLISFPNPGIANEYELKVAKDWESQKSVYANLSYFVVVTNEINDTMKKSATVCVSGLTTGIELKLWIEREFTFSEIYMPKYVLQIRVGKNKEIVKEDIPLLILYEHLLNRGTRNACLKGCALTSTAPGSAVCISINLNVLENNEDKNIDTQEIYYSIEEKWGADMMPNWLMRLLSDLYYNGPLYEGVFRLSGKESSLDLWYKRMLDYDDFIITENIYSKAAILKHFIRNIKGSLMTTKYRKDFNNISKKFTKISAEKYLENEKKREKLFRLVLQLPKTHLLLLQHLLVVLQALAESPKTLMKPFSIALSISASIFPLLPLLQWKCGATMFEAIILQTDKLVSQSLKSAIIESYAKFREPVVPETGGNVCSNSTIDLSCSSSLSSVTGPDYKTGKNHMEEDEQEEEEDFSGSDLYLSSSDEELLSNIKSTSDDRLSSLDLENRSSMKSIFPSSSETDNCIPTNHFVEQGESIISMDTSGNCNEDRFHEEAKSFLNGTDSCLKTQEELEEMSCSGEKSSNLTVFVGNVNLKENDGEQDEEEVEKERDEENQNPVDVKQTTSSFVEKSTDDSVQHRTLLKSNNSMYKDLKRSTSTIVRSPIDFKLRNVISEGDSSDRGEFTKTDICRKYSRKTLSVVQESNNFMDLSHRSRSPNVKNLIKLYEEKNKAACSEDSSSTENSMKKLAYSKRKIDRL